jgi:CRISPR-associated protein Cas1
MVKDDFFETLEQGLGLSKEGKAALIDAINKALEEPMEYRGRNVKRRNTIQLECHRIANSLIRPGQDLPLDFDLEVEEAEDVPGGGGCSSG